MNSSSSPASVHRKVSFGLFEADLASGELWRSGFRVRLQGQPFKVLAALLERPGEVVTRAELQERLWGQNTNVDFEHSLGTAVNKLREALGDSADNPRFVETLARRGYRFIAPVTFAPSVADAANDADRNGEEAPVEKPATVKEVQSFSAPATPLPDAEILCSARNEKLSGLGRFMPFAAIVCLLALAILALALWQPADEPSAPLAIQQVTRSGRVSPGNPAFESFAASVTDGSRLYFASLGLSGEGGRAVLAQTPLRGGDGMPVPVPSEITDPSIDDISPDGSRILLRNHLAAEAEQALWIVPASGGSAQRVRDVLAHDATWMPDGHTLLYASGNELWQLDESGAGEPVHYAALPGRAFWLRWSPDGRTLRFTLSDPRTHSTSLWEMRAGSSPHPLLAAWGGAGTRSCCGSWANDGRAYVFESNRRLTNNNDVPPTNNIWMIAEQRGLVERLRSMLLGGSARREGIPVPLTAGPLSYGAPTTARDDAGIFFLGLDARSELLRFDAAEHAFVSVGNRLDEARRVSYARDGQWVAFIDDQGGLWRARPNGSERLQLTSPPMQVFLASWSPNDRQLVLMASEPGKPFTLYLVDANGDRPRRLLREDRNSADPDWSPDGTQIVFGRLPDLMSKEQAPKTIVVMDLQTGATREIPGSKGLFSPRWSPDGRWIVASSLDQRRIYLYGVPGAGGTGSWRLLAQTSVADPAWSADSRAVYFHAFMEPEEPIDRVSIPEGVVTRVAGSRDVRARSEDALDFSFSGLAPGDVPLIRARTWTANLYGAQLPH